MTILDLDKALEYTGGESEFFIELAQAFIDDEPLDIKKLKDLEEKDSLQAASYVHYYKGAARQLAAIQMSQTGQALEDILRGKAQGNIAELNAKFLDDYGLTLKALKEAVTKLNQQEN